MICNTLRCIQIRRTNTVSYRRTLGFFRDAVVGGQFAAEAFLAGATKGPCSTLAETEMHELSPLALHAHEDELCTKKPQSFQSAPVTDKRRQVSVPCRSRCRTCGRQMRHQMTGGSPSKARNLFPPEPRSLGDNDDKRTFSDCGAKLRRRLEKHGQAGYLLLRCLPGRSRDSGEPEIAKNE
jgi:hypothetical protein